MPYSTLDDLKKQISENTIIDLTDDEGAGVVEEARVTEAIAKADAMIDSYCGQVESVPFTTIPPIVKQHSVTLAIYNLYTRRSVAPELVKDNYKDAIKHLQDIATGRASLPVPGETGGGDDILTGRDEGDRIITMGKKSDGSSGTLDNY